MRKSQIETNTGHKVFVIDCREDLTGIHSQIHNLVSHINKLYTKQNEKGTFKPWRPDNEYNPIYWKEKGIISTTDEISFHTIDDICLGPTSKLQGGCCFVNFYIYFKNIS